MSRRQRSGEPPSVTDERWNELKHEARERAALREQRGAEAGPQHDAKKHRRR